MAGKSKKKVERIVIKQHPDLKFEGQPVQIGDVVTVSPGYARNFLDEGEYTLPNTRENRERVESQRARLEAAALEALDKAVSIENNMYGLSLVFIRQASDQGRLYGSIMPSDIITEFAARAEEKGLQVEIGREAIQFESPIKDLGIHKVNIKLHPEVTVGIEVNVARSQDEADRQQYGDDYISDPLDLLNEDTPLGDDDVWNPDRESYQEWEARVLESKMSLSSLRP